jgi:hypothetical protein
MSSVSAYSGTEPAERQAVAVAPLGDAGEAGPGVDARSTGFSASGLTPCAAPTRAILLGAWPPDPTEP